MDEIKKEPELYLESIGKDRIFSVRKFDVNTPLIDGKGYLFEDDSIYIFSSTSKKCGKIPYMWYDNGTLIKGEVTEAVSKYYNKNNVTDYSYEVISSMTQPGEVIYDEKELSDMNNASSFPIPVITENDDFLKMVVKHVIIDKNINVNRLKSKTDKKHTFANLLSALMNDTKMSVFYFRIWMELLGCNFHIVVEDDGTDLTNP